MTTRDDFETWYLTPLLSGGGGGVILNLHREPDGTYTVAAVQLLWVSWQANEANKSSRYSRTRRDRL